MESPWKQFFKILLLEIAGEIQEEIQFRLFQRCTKDQLPFFLLAGC